MQQTEADQKIALIVDYYRLMDSDHRRENLDGYLAPSVIFHLPESVTTRGLDEYWAYISQLRMPGVVGVSHELNNIAVSDDDKNNINIDIALHLKKQDGEVTVMPGRGVYRVLQGKIAEVWL